METRTFKTRCKLCNARGVIHVTPIDGGEVRLRDGVKHRKGCPRHVGPKPQPKHFQRKGWIKQEKRANALVGARETLMSGSVNEDGDGRVFHGWRVESKQTKKDKYRLSTDVWQKLCKGALEAGEEPLLHVEIGSLPTRIVLLREDWASHHIDINEAQGMIEVNGKGATLNPAELVTPMWIEGMSPTPWILFESDFKKLSIDSQE